MYTDDFLKENELLRRLNEIALSHACVEGNLLYQHPLTSVNAPLEPLFFEKRCNLFELAKDSSNVMEIGFNAGHSALLMLLANPGMKMTLVDLDFHLYTKPCFSFLKEYFDIEIFYGDSRVVVPTLYDSYDMIHVDGSHELQYASVDYENVKKLSTRSTIVVFDDTTPGNDLDVFLKQKFVEGDIQLIQQPKETPFQRIFNFLKV